VQRKAEQGELRRVYKGIYTTDLVQPIETIVRRHLRDPDPRQHHLSSIRTRGEANGRRQLYLTASYRRDIQLPGVKLRIAEGKGPLDSDIRIPTFHGNAHLSSQPGRCSRTWSRVEVIPQKSGRGGPKGSKSGSTGSLLEMSPVPSIRFETKRGRSLSRSAAGLVPMKSLSADDR